MLIDFSNFRIQKDCFNTEELGLDLLKKDSSIFFSKICELLLLENCSKEARETWQLNQLNHSLQYVRKNSLFWGDRIPNNPLQNLEELKNIPIQTRQDVKKQVESEGCLIESEKADVHYTSGSSSVPLKFFVPHQEMYFNIYRLFMRYMISNIDISENFTSLYASSYLSHPGFIASCGEGEGRNGFLSTGFRKVIKYSNPDIKLFKQELSSHKIGHLTVNPYMLETLHEKIYSLDEMKLNGLTSCKMVGGKISKTLREKCNDLGVKIISEYASEEIGMIGYECNSCEDHYHVTGSNVIVECIPEENLKLKNDKLGRLLITKINCKATPFIRYDIGDIGELLEECPCGHKGPTIKNLYGRAKSLARKKDGSITPFLIQVKNHPFIADYKEYRIIQTDLNTIRIQISGISSISEEEVKQWAGIVYDQLGKDGINIEIELLDEIDWGGSKKKIPFKSLVI
jgi:phenylacetate-CoA ligase